MSCQLPEDSKSSSLSLLLQYSVVSFTASDLQAGEWVRSHLDFLVFTHRWDRSGRSIVYDRAAQHFSQTYVSVLWKKTVWGKPWNAASVFLLLVTRKAVFSPLQYRMMKQSNLNNERGITNADLFLCKAYVGVLVSQHGSQPKQMVLSQLFYVLWVRHSGLQGVSWNTEWWHRGDNATNIKFLDCMLPSSV